MAGLLHRAMQVANNPAMQPMISNTMSSLMGASGGGSGGTGPAGGSCTWHAGPRRRVHLVIMSAVFDNAHVPQGGGYTQAPIPGTKPNSGLDSISGCWAGIQPAMYMAIYGF
jgi:hypothetical protein